ncbi:DUF2835 family protein [Salinimonas sediminis]|uniref:DUF2835 family protein n=1 Tax=Salinimonas sediminis TaxID=2303538 RepID=UPI001E5A88F2|nr:DUF2835 family protein [Salinimonas sediminis]
MSSTNTYYFTLNLSYNQCERLYQAGYQHAVLNADSGHRVQIPIVRLRPFVTTLGLKGRFRLITNAANKIVTFERLN